MSIAAATEPEFATAFDWAVVRLATYYPAESAQARLLFASVSLLTKDRPRPVDGNGLESHKVGKGKRGKVFFKRTVMRAREAINWYRHAGPGGMSTPLPEDFAKVDPKSDGISLSPAAFADDPTWPALGVALGADLFANANDPATPRHSKVQELRAYIAASGESSGFDAVIEDRSTIAFLRRRVHLDLADYGEYLGGLALIVPDPVLRRVEHFLVSPQNESEAERVVFRLIPRSGQSLTDLKFTVLERRANLLSRFETREIKPDGLVSVESDLPFDQTGYAIAHSVHGVIAYQPPVPFIRAIRGSFGVAGRRVKVQVTQTESQRSADASYEVSEFAHEIPISVGKDRDDAIVKVTRAELNRLRKAAARQYRQTWFEGGQRRKAMAFLQSQIAQARESVMVADPYFGGQQILQFLQAVPRNQIDFTILTSRLAFEQESRDRQSDEPPGGVVGRATNGAESENLAKFERGIATLHVRRMKSVTALVLAGRTPPLHDRFLVIDSEVLFLGNSLNALGERASLVLSLPDSQSVLLRLKAMARTAVLFEAYAAQRRSAWNTPSDEN